MPLSEASFLANSQPRYQLREGGRAGSRERITTTTTTTTPPRLPPSPRPRSAAFITSPMNSPPTTPLSPPSHLFTSLSGHSSSQGTSPSGGGSAGPSPPSLWSGSSSPQGLEDTGKGGGLLSGGRSSREGHSRLPSTDSGIQADAGWDSLTRSTRDSGTKVSAESPTSPDHRTPLKTLTRCLMEPRTASNRSSWGEDKSSSSSSAAGPRTFSASVRGMSRMTSDTDDVRSRHNADVRDDPDAGTSRMTSSFPGSDRTRPVSVDMSDRAPTTKGEEGEGRRGAGWRKGGDSLMSRSMDSSLLTSTAPSSRKEHGDSSGPRSSEQAPRNDQRRNAAYSRTVSAPADPADSVTTARSGHEGRRPEALAPRSGPSAACKEEDSPATAGERGWRGKRIGVPGSGTASAANVSSFPTPPSFSADLLPSRRISSESRCTPPVTLLSSSTPVIPSSHPLPDNNNNNSSSGGGGGGSGGGGGGGGAGLIGSSLDKGMGGGRRRELFSPAELRLLSSSSSSPLSSSSLSSLQTHDAVGGGGTGLQRYPLSSSSSSSSYSRAGAASVVSPPGMAHSGSTGLSASLDGSGSSRSWGHHQHHPNHHHYHYHDSQARPGLGGHHHVRPRVTPLPVTHLLSSSSSSRAGAGAGVGSALGRTRHVQVVHQPGRSAELASSSVKDLGAARNCGTSSTPSSPSSSSHAPAHTASVSSSASLNSRGVRVSPQGRQHMIKVHALQSSSSPPPPPASRALGPATPVTGRLHPESPAPSSSPRQSSGIRGSSPPGPVAAQHVAVASADLTSRPRPSAVYRSKLSPVLPRHALGRARIPIALSPSSFSSASSTSRSPSSSSPSPGRPIPVLHVDTCSAWLKTPASDPSRVPVSGGPPEDSSTRKAAANSSDNLTQTSLLPPSSSSFSSSSSSSSSTIPGDRRVKVIHLPSTAQSVLTLLERPAVDRGVDGGGEGEGKDKKSDVPVVGTGEGLPWEERRVRMDTALNWLKGELESLRAMDAALMTQFRRCQNTLEGLKQDLAWGEDGEGSEWGWGWGLDGSELDEEEEAWEDWEIAEFERKWAEDPDAREVEITLLPVTSSETKGSDVALPAAMTSQEGKKSPSPIKQDVEASL